MRQSSLVPNIQSLVERMRADWDARIVLDYRAWMNDQVDSDTELWATGVRDFRLLVQGVKLSDLHNQVCIELGCGVGRLLRPASSVFQHVIGIDVSLSAIDRAKKLLADRQNISFITGNGSDLLPLKSDSIDFAYSFGVLPHMPTIIMVGYLIELSRVLKSSGVARLQLFLGKGEPSVKEDTAAYRSYQRSSFVDAVSQAGFAVESITELDLGVKLPEDGLLKPEIVALRKIGTSQISAVEMEKILLPHGEASASEDWAGSYMEYVLACTFAVEKVALRQFAEAENFLRFATIRYKKSDNKIFGALRAVQLELESEEAE